MVTNRIFVAASLFSFALLPFAARADVHVSTWAELKDAVENGSGGTIYLDKDITTDLNSPITKYAAGTVIDGQGFKLIGPEQTGDTKVNANFFNFTTDFSKDFTEEQRLKMQNLNFENGVKFSKTNVAVGGAFYQINNTMGDISGNFSDNYIFGQYYAFGGAIYNYGTIGNITGNFTKNYAQSEVQTRGGAIYNFYGYMGDITGNFTDNSVQSRTSQAYGGAIGNDARIRKITGNFYGNHVQSEKSSAYGGAIYNKGKIGNISNSSFYNNYVQTGTADINNAQGGAIYHSYEDLLIMPHPRW